MIKGTGIDIIELARITAAVKKKARFVKRILTETEQMTYDAFEKDIRKVEYLAGRFAAKEAFAKAAGTGIGSLSFQDIDVVSDENGKPCITAKGFEQESIFLSISHSKTYAIAQVIITSQ